MSRKKLWRQARLRALRGLPRLFRVVPEAWGRELCGLLGVAGHAAVARDRRRARSNLRRVHPDWSERRVRREARRVFREVGRNAYEFLRHPDRSPATRRARVLWEGDEILDRLAAKGQGAVLVTAHLGCWEILAAALADRGYPLRVLARPLREPDLEEAVSGHRRRMGISVLSSDRRSPAPLRHLRAGGFLGLLADQRIKGGGVPVTFLGQPTRMTDAPARWARAAGVPIVPLGIHRESAGTHRVTVLGPLPLDPNPETSTRAVARALETLIRRHPRQWIWMHPRWEAGRERGVVFSLNSRQPGPGKPGEGEIPADTRKRGRACASALR